MVKLLYNLKQQMSIQQSKIIKGLFLQPHFFLRSTLRIEGAENLFLTNRAKCGNLTIENWSMIGDAVIGCV